MNNDKLKAIYPLDFNEDQKKEYDHYIRQAKLLYPEAEDFIIKLATEAYIRQGDSERPKFSSEEIEAIKNRYDTKTEYISEIDVSLLEVKDDPCKWVETKTDASSNVIEINENNENIILHTNRNEDL